MAVLSFPRVLLYSASAPVAVLRSPSVSVNRVFAPRAVLNPAVVSFKSASKPRKVFSRLPHPSWQTARACGASAKHAPMNAIKQKPPRKGDQRLEFLVIELLVFIEQSSVLPIG